MISIVTSYFNRRTQFINTLRSLTLSKFKDFEVIVVDDGSDDEHKIDDLEMQFKFLKVIRVEKRDKWYYNPCIPFNLAFSKCSGDKIIIQNPECLHYSDILTKTQESLNDENYLSFATYSLNRTESENLNKFHKAQDFFNNFEFINKSIETNGDNGWYNHGIYRPCALHFCSAITRKNLKDLNGFDESYALGICYDDNEFLHRIILKKLNIIFQNNHIAVHQFHENFNYNQARSQELEYRNNVLYTYISRKSSEIRANNRNQNIIN